MDAINLLPVKPMDAASPRSRSDVAPDQAESGFSFESLLDERNAPTPRQPSKEPEEQGGDLPVEVPERPAAENGAEASTLVAMLSTLPPPVPLPPPLELRETAFAGTALPETAEAVPSAPPADGDSAVALPRHDGATTPDGLVGTPSSAPQRKETPVIEQEDARTVAPDVTKLPVAAAPLESATLEDAMAPQRKETPVAERRASRTITPDVTKLPVAVGFAEDASAFTPETGEAQQDASVVTREVVAIPSVESISNTVAVPGAATSVVVAPPDLPVAAPVVVATTGSQPAPVTRRTATLNLATPAVVPRAPGREAEGLLVGMTEIPRDAGPFTHELPVLPAALEGESLTRSSVPLPPGTVVADVPEGVEIEIIGSERRAASILAGAVTPATEHTAQAPAPVPLSSAQESAQVQVPTQVSPRRSSAPAPGQTPLSPTPPDHQADGAIAPQRPQAASPDRAVIAPGKSPVAISADGTSAAMQERVMPDNFQPRVPEPKTAGPAANFNAAEPATPTIGARMQGDSPFQNQSDANARQEEKSTFQQQPNEVTATAPTFANSFVAPARPTTEPTAITRTDVETIINRTAEAVEQLRVTGHERVEVQVRLEAGQELTVRLRITNGEVQPVFLTESQDLRRAIEQNWAQFSERTSDRTTRVTTPIFESPNSQSGMNDLNQRQREGREWAYSQAQAEAFAAANTPRRPTVSGPTITAPAGLQLYA